MSNISGTRYSYSRIRLLSKIFITVEKSYILCKKTGNKSSFQY